MRIRELKVSDAGRYQALRLRALKEHPTAFRSSYEQECDRLASTLTERLRRTFDSPDAFNLGCFIDENLVGTVGLFREKGAKVMHTATIVGMHVSAEHQRKGYGRALLVAALERARQMPRLVRICLGVGLEKRALFVDGEYLDEELMALELD